MSELVKTKKKKKSHRSILPLVSKLLSTSSLECALITSACKPVLEGQWGVIGGEVADQIVLIKFYHLSSSCAFDVIKIKCRDLFWQFWEFPFTK